VGESWVFESGDPRFGSVRGPAVSDSESEQVGGRAVRGRAYEISLRTDAGTAEENWLRAERELRVAHDYDTVDRDLERLGMIVSRLPSEAGVVWRLRLPRGESVEAWEPGTAGLAPPDEIARLIAGVAAGKPLVPAPPVSDDPGAIRLREAVEEQRRALLVHDPGTRLGDDPENLHQHRVAARRARAFLRAARAYLDPVWRRTLAASLAELGEATGPVRDLDVLLEHVRRELDGLDEPDRAGGGMLVATLELERESAGRRLLDALDGDGYRALLLRLRQPPRLAPEVDAVPLARIARAEFRRLVNAVDRLGRHPDETAIHRLRIAVKRARYAAELSAPKGKAGRRFLADARTLQNLLGEHQDAVVAEQRLRSSAVVDLRTAAAFVAGRLAERQRVRRTRVTERLPAAWKRLRKSGARLD
jgi:CHAD domain-containing protein